MLSILNSLSLLKSFLGFFKKDKKRKKITMRNFSEYYFQMIDYRIDFF